MSNDKKTESTTIYKLDKDAVKDEWNGMPSDDIDPKLKRGTWALAWARFIYSQFFNNQCYTTWDKLSTYRLLRLYGAGKQPREFYMDTLLGSMSDKNNVNENGIRKGYYNVNWDIWSPCPKFKRIVIGRFESQDHSISANAIDPLSGAEKEKMMYKAWADSLFAKQEAEVKKMVGLRDANRVKYLPDSLEELQMYSEMGGFKMSKEIDIEKALDYTDYISKEKRLRRRLFGDFFDINIAAEQDYFDPIDKKIKYRYIDPEYSVFDYSKESDFNDMRFWATQRLMSIKQVRIESGISENELRKLALTFENVFGNPNGEYINRYSFAQYKNKDGVYVYDTYKIPVWVCEWKSVDKKYRMTRETPMGKLTFEQEGKDYGKVWDSDKRKTEITEYQNVYTCNWIMGSEHVFGDGQLDLVPRDAQKRVNMTAHVYALDGPSIVESIKENLDQIQITKLKLQNELAESAPNGIKVEFGSLNNISLGNKEMKPLDLLKLYRQRGDIIYKATTHAGKLNQFGSPIEPIKGGIGLERLQEFTNLFEMNFQMISEACGIDRTSAASQKPGEPVTATETKFAVASTTDALQPMYSGFMDIRESAARNAAYRIQTIVKYVPGAYNVYYPILGQATMQELKLSKDDSDYGIKIEALPTEQEMMDARNAAQEALKPGKDGENISYGEYLLITQMIGLGQIKQAVAVLNFRLNKRKKEALDLQQQNMELNAKNAQQTEKIKIDGELQKIRTKAIEDRKTQVLVALIQKDAGEDQHTKDLQKMYLQKILDGTDEQPPVQEQNAPPQPAQSEAA